MAKQSKLTRAARGQECTAEIVPYCNYNPETVVLDDRIKHNLSEVEKLKKGE